MRNDFACSDSEWELSKSRCYLFRWLTSNGISSRSWGPNRGYLRPIIKGLQKDQRLLSKEFFDRLERHVTSIGSTRIESEFSGVMLQCVFLYLDTSYSHFSIQLVCPSARTYLKLEWQAANFLPPRSIA
jgi:hypothetical protein